MEQKRVYLMEIGPRDGFQNVTEYIPLEQKAAIVDGLVQAGYRRIMLTSFVNPKAIPQLRDAGDLSELMLNRYPEVRFSALVPNYRGAAAAVNAGYREINPVLSLSESHNQANVRRSIDASLQEIERICQEFPDVQITQDIATVFGCPFEGVMHLDALLLLIDRLRSLGIRELTLCDTVGLAYPTLVETVFGAVRKEFPDLRFNAHFHDTRNMGILNSYLAIQAGANVIQTSVGGLGGCPFAPGASGNTSSEDLVYLLNNCGYETGVDYEKLLAVARFEYAHIKGEYSGHQIKIDESHCRRQ